MVTLLDCIHRIPQIVHEIIDHRKETFSSFFEILKEPLADCDQLVLIGSGTSNTAALTARGFIEKVTQIPTVCILPNQFLHHHSVYNPKALYIFTSQSGTSTLTQEAVAKMRQMGNWTVGMTESEDTMLASQVHVHIDMGCKKEEYGMRTIGYCASILTLMVMGLEIALHSKRITEGEVESLLNQARLTADHHRTVCDDAMAWFDRHRDQLLNSSSFTLYGPNALWGVAQEGALKILEISKTKMAIGYELDDGMHGPTMGFTPTNCVIVLNEGGLDNEKAIQLSTWAKQEMHNGFIIGCNPIDEKDCPILIESKDFAWLLFAPVVEILAYRLAIDAGIDLLDKSIHKERQYFTTHQQVINNK